MRCVLLTGVQACSLPICEGRRCAQHQRSSLPDQPPDHAPAARVSPVQSRAHVPEVHLPRNFEGLLPFGECNIANRQNQLCGDETGPCSASGTLLPSKHKNSYERRSEEHTSELQSLMRNSYAVFCLKKKKQTTIK